MKTTISKTVLTLTAFMSVNAVFANSLPPCIEGKKQDITFVAQKTNEEKKLANTLPPTPEYKGIANTLPPTPEYRGIANTLPPTPEYKGIANTLPPTPEHRGLASTLPPTFEGRISRHQMIDIKGMNAQHVNMG